MKIAILVFDKLTALDAIGPYEVLSRIPEVDLRFVAQEPGEKRTDTGALGITADAALADFPDPDILLVPGGEGNRPLMEDAEVLDWVRAAHEGTTWTTSVCTGSLVLARGRAARGQAGDQPLGLPRRAAPVRRRAGRRARRRRRQGRHRRRRLGRESTWRCT